IPELLREGFDEDIQFEIDFSKASHPLYIVQMWISVNSHALQEEFQWLRKALIYEKSRPLRDIN
ncbi:hypothetical protein STEG23_023292, partial [Scotinomys teguina]